MTNERSHSEPKCTCPTVPDMDGNPIPVPSFGDACSNCRGSWYLPGTVLEDRDEDRWIVQKDTTKIQILLDDEPDGVDVTLEFIEEGYGPLKVVETPQAIQPFAGMRALSDALTRPWFPGIDWGGVTINNPKTGLQITAAQPDDADRGFIVSQKILDKSQSVSGPDFPDNVLEVFSEAYNVLLRKNADYGPRNIADSPGGPLNGLLVRMWDKMARLKNLIETGADPQNESVRDTFLDLANYSLIAMIVLDYKWPGMAGEAPCPCDGDGDPGSPLYGEHKRGDHK